MLTALAQASLLHQEGKQGGLKKADSGLASRLETATQARGVSGKLTDARRVAAMQACILQIGGFNWGSWRAGMPILSIAHRVERRLLHNMHVSSWYMPLLLLSQSLLSEPLLAPPAAQSIDYLPSSTSLQAVKMAYSQCPSMEVLVPAILEHGPMVSRDEHRLAS